MRQGFLIDAERVDSSPRERCQRRGPHAAQAKNDRVDGLHMSCHRRHGPTPGRRIELAAHCGAINAHKKPLGSEEPRGLKGVSAKAEASTKTPDERV
jgi:hypothetical protein